MPDFNSILLSLVRVDGSPLDETDQTKLREFYLQFLHESDAELERKRGIMRNRLRLDRTRTHGLTINRTGGEALMFQTVQTFNWSNAHLDQAKFDILTAIIQDRHKPKSVWDRIKGWGFVGGIITGIAKLFS